MFPLFAFTVQIHLFARLIITCLVIWHCITQVCTPGNRWSPRSTSHHSSVYMVLCRSSGKRKQTGLLYCIYNSFSQRKKTGKSIWLVTRKEHFSFNDFKRLFFSQRKLPNECPYKGKTILIESKEVPICPIP